MSENENQREVGSEKTKKCRFCGETIKFDAIKCRFCNEFLEATHHQSVFIRWFLPILFLIFGTAFLVSIIFQNNFEKQNTTKTSNNFNLPNSPEKQNPALIASISLPEENNKPGQIAENYYRLVEKGQIEMAINCLFVENEDMKKGLRSYLPKMREFIEKDGGLKRINLLNEKIVGETGEVVLEITTGSGKPKKEEFSLIKVGTDWKINFLLTMELARKSSKGKTCQANSVIIRGAIEMYNLDHPKEMIREELSEKTFQNLIKENYLTGVPSCPEKGFYSVIGDFSTENKENTVSCSIHGAYLKEFGSEIQEKKELVSETPQSIAKECISRQQELDRIIRVWEVRNERLSYDSPIIGDVDIDGNLVLNGKKMELQKIDGKKKNFICPGCKEPKPHSTYRFFIFPHCGQGVFCAANVDKAIDSNHNERIGEFKLSTEEIALLKSFDEKTFTACGLKWKAGPDADVNFDGAQTWITGLGSGWQTPTHKQLGELYDSKCPLPFKEFPSIWVWATERDSSSAWGVNFIHGGESWISRGDQRGDRVLAVATR